MRCRAASGRSGKMEGAPVRRRKVLGLPSGEQHGASLEQLFGSVGPQLDGTSDPHSNEETGRSHAVLHE